MADSELRSVDRNMQSPVSIQLEFLQRKVVFKTKHNFYFLCQGVKIHISVRAMPFLMHFGGSNEVNWHELRKSVNPVDYVSI